MEYTIKKSWCNGRGGKWTARVQWAVNAQGVIRLHWETGVREFGKYTKKKQGDEYPSNEKSARVFWEMFQFDNPKVAE